MSGGPENSDLRKCVVFAAYELKTMGQTNTKTKQAKRKKRELEKSRW